MPFQQERMPFQQERMPFQPWEYRTETGLTGEDNLDPTGHSIAAADGDIGHVDDVTDEVGSPYLVVNGAWIFGRKVLLPAGVVERIDTGEKVYVDRTKDQIKAAPEYRRTVDDAQYREHVAGYYSETYNGPDPRM